MLQVRAHLRGNWTSSEDSTASNQDGGVVSVMIGGSVPMVKSWPCHSRASQHCTSPPPPSPYAVVTWQHHGCALPCHQLRRQRPARSGELLGTRPGPPCTGVGFLGFTGRVLSMRVMIAMSIVGKLTVRVRCSQGPRTRAKGLGLGWWT